MTDMNLRVSADNITSLTAGAGPSDYAGAPTVHKMIKRIRERLADNIKNNRTDNWPYAENLERYSPDEIRRQAEQDARDFEQILKDVPPGFRLAPVLYTRVTREEAYDLNTEFTTIRPRFLSFLAEQHAAHLRNIGLDEHAIGRMRKGLDPLDANNKAYYLNVDHIIERGGSGNLASVKSRDPDCTQCTDPVSPVNHFGNLMLLPGQIHAEKNKLNEIQGMRSLKGGSSRWILMLVPECPCDKPRFITAPLPKSHPLGGLVTYVKDAKNSLSHAFKKTQRLAGALKHFAWEQRQDGAKGKPFATQFGGYFTNVFRETCDTIMEAFKFAAGKGDAKGSRNALEKFDEFIFGEEISALENNAHYLPPSEQTALTGVLSSVRQRMNNMTGNRGFRQNNNHRRH